MSPLIKLSPSPSPPSPFFFLISSYPIPFRRFPSNPSTLPSIYTLPSLAAALHGSLSHPQLISTQVYGPHNATLYASPSVLPRLSSLGHYFHTPATTLATKLALAGSSYELVFALPAIVSYFGPNASDRASTWQTIAEHEEKLQAILLDYLRGRKDITIYGEPSADKALRVPVISFSVEGRNSKDVVEEVEKRSGGFAVRWGHFYSKRLVDDILGLGGKKGGVVRVSMVHYNTGKLAPSISTRMVDGGGS